MSQVLLFKRTCATTAMDSSLNRTANGKLIEDKLAVWEKMRGIKIKPELRETILLKMENTGMSPDYIVRSEGISLDSIATDAKWDESKHPRKHGQFAKKGTGTTGKTAGSSGSVSRKNAMSNIKNGLNELRKTSKKDGGWSIRPASVSGRSNGLSMALSLSTKNDKVVKLFKDNGFKVVRLSGGDYFATLSKKKTNKTAGSSGKKTNKTAGKATAKKDGGFTGSLTEKIMSKTFANATPKHRKYMEKEHLDMENKAHRLAKAGKSDAFFDHLADIEYVKTPTRKKLASALLRKYCEKTDGGAYRLKGSSAR